MKPAIQRLALACAAALVLAGGAAAQSDAPTPAQQKELDAARAELDRAAKNYAELTRKYNTPGAAPMIMTYEKQMVRKPVLGVLLGPDSQAGVRIAGVTPASGAAQAGLKGGDRLVSLDGIAVAGADGEARLADVRKKLANLDASTPVRVGYVRNGHETTASVTPHVADRLFLLNDSGGPAIFSGNVSIQEGADGDFSGASADSLEIDVPPGIAPEIHREVIRIGEGVAPKMPGDALEMQRMLAIPDCDSANTHCKQPMLLMDAFRWNGLNLASLDAQLGRYFGTDKGVLVLSAGSQLPGLQPGDVIRSVDGVPVSTPRDAMDALRARRQGEQASLALLRDHQDASVQVTVPKAMPLPIPPPPPEAPAAPPAPDAGDVPAPPAPPAAPRIVERRHVVVVDDNGKRTEWNDDGDVPAPPAPPAPPSAAKAGDVPAPPAPPSAPPAAN